MRLTKQHAAKKELVSRVERLTNSKLSLSAAAAAANRRLRSRRRRRRGRSLFLLSRLFLSRLFLSRIGGRLLFLGRVRRLLSRGFLRCCRRLSRSFLRRSRGGSFRLISVAGAKEPRDQQTGD